MTAPTTVPSRGAPGILDGSAGRRWRLLSPPSLEGYADAGSALPELIRAILAHRGVTTTEAARRFLGSPRELTDPLLMPNLERAVTRLAEACERGETVAVYGDYDVDGITATCVLVEGLTALGAHPVPYLPDRFTEGYGVNIQAIRRLADLGSTLLVTADTGTSAVTEIAEATSLGLDTIVIDHHAIPETLPEALAIVNPHLEGKRYGSEPPAVGVAYKVIHDLHDRLGRDYDPDEHRALVTLGTICDVAPLIAENRDLVRLGLSALQRTERPGLRALFEEAHLDPGAISVDGVGWAVGPRINAAGRMAHAQIALDLLLAPTILEARSLASELERLNEARRDEGAAALEAARAVADAGAPLIIVESPEISKGIVGIVAGRLADEYARPAIVMEVAGGYATASCRSVPGFDVTALLERHADLFVRFGGHRAAAGFTIEAARIPELRVRLVADAAEHLDLHALVPTIDIDAELALASITPKLVQWLRLMEPHGEGNRCPVFLARGVEVLDTRAVGADGSHLALRVRDGDRDAPGSTIVWRAISFRNAEHAVPAGGRADIVYSLKRDDYQGNGAMQLEVLDLRPAE